MTENISCSQQEMPACYVNQGEQGSKPMSSRP